MECSTVVIELELVGTKIKYFYSSVDVCEFVCVLEQYA